MDILSQEQYNGVVQKAAEAFDRVDPHRLQLSQFTLSAGVSGEETVIADLQAPVLVGLLESARTNRIAVPAYETFTTNATADDTETFTLGYDLIDSGFTGSDLSVYRDDGNTVERLPVKATDYAANTFDVSDGGTDNTLHAFYNSGAQAQVRLKKRGPKNSVEQLDSFDIGMLHREDPDKTPINFDFDTPLQGVVPPNFSLEMTIDAPYQARWRTPTTASERVTAEIGLLSFSQKRVNAEIPRITTAVQMEMSQG